MNEHTAPLKSSPQTNWKARARAFLTGAIASIIAVRPTFAARTRAITLFEVMTIITVMAQITSAQVFDGNIAKQRGTALEVASALDGAGKDIILVCQATCPGYTTGTTGAFQDSSLWTDLTTDGYTAGDPYDKQANAPIAATSVELYAGTGTVCVAITAQGVYDARALMDYPILDPSTGTTRGAVWSDVVPSGGIKSGYLVWDSTKQSPYFIVGTPTTVTPSC